jgi:ATP-dependent RNA helicase DeaD
MPLAIMRIAQRHMHNPVNIREEIIVPKHKLKQLYYDVKDDEKISLLVHLIKKEKPNLAIVFCSTKRLTDIVARLLAEQGIEAKAIHGDLSQQQRSHVMDGFHKGRLHVLVATDVASRGLDIKDVTHVFNFDVPQDLDNYTHRIGRTARIGKEGKAILLLSKKDHDAFRRLLRKGEIIQKGEKEDFPRLRIKFHSDRQRNHGFHKRRFHRR